MNKYTAALAIVENEEGSDDEKVAFILSSIGAVYGMKDEYDKATDVLNRALVIRKEKLGQDHWETANTVMNISNVLSKESMKRRWRSISKSCPFTRRDMEAEA